MWTLACTGTQLKACGNEPQLLLPPTHCLALVAGAHFVACSAASSCTRCGQMHYNYNIFKVWHAAAGARWLGPSIMPQRISALSISGRHLPHNGTMVRLKSVRCARLALSGRYTHTQAHTHIPIYLCIRVTSVVSCTKCPQVWSHCLLPSPFHSPHFDHFAVRCFQDVNLFWGCSSVFFNSTWPASLLFLCVCVSVYAHPFGKNCA